MPPVLPRSRPARRRRRAGAAAQAVPPHALVVAGRHGARHELTQDPDEARRVGVVGEVPGLVEDLELAARHHGVDQAAVAQRDDGVAPSPHDQRRDPFGQVGPVHHGDHLAVPVDARPQRAQDAHAGLRVGQCVEDSQDLLGIPPEGGVEESEQLRAQAAGEADRWEPEERHEQLDAGHGGHPQQRADRPAHSPAADQDQALTAVGELVGELRRHAAAQGVPDDGDPVDLQHAQEVAHPVGEARHRVVGPWLLGAPVPEQVRRDDRVVLHQLLEDRSPAVGAVPDAVDQQERGPRAGLDVGAPVAVDGDVLDFEGALAPNARPVADRRRVDRTVGAGGVCLRAWCRVGRVCRLRRGRRLTHTDLPCWSSCATGLVVATVRRRRVRAVSTL